jgi:hypothetical protein
MLFALAVVVILGKGDSHAFGRYTHYTTRDGDFPGFKLVRDGHGYFQPEGWRLGGRCLDKDASQTDVSQVPSGEALKIGDVDGQATFPAFMNPPFSKY